MNVLRQPDDDLFRYGYRYVARSDERGRQTFVMVPLTEEDVLHPQLEDHVTQNEPHDEDCGYIKVACQIRLAGNPNALVLHDCKIIWDIAGMGDHGPDIAVIFGARRGERASFDVAKEGVRPAIIIEVTSRSTRDIDLKTKPRHYWRCRVPCYVIVDELPRRRPRQLRILGYQRGPRGYRRLALNDQGRLWLQALQMWLGQENGRVVCYDQNGQPIPNPVQAALERELAEQARQQAEEERDQAEQRAAQAEQERDQAEQEREQAEQEREQARLHAEQEAQARGHAEAEVARLQEELRRLRDGK